MLGIGALNRLTLGMCLHLMEAAAAASKATSVPSSNSRCGNRTVSQCLRAKVLFAIMRMLPC